MTILNIPGGKNTLYRTKKYNISATTVMFLSERRTEAYSE